MSSTSRKQRRSEKQQRLEQQQRFLNSLSSDQERVESIWRRERKKGNCPWLLDTPDYKAWKADGGSVLRVVGNLGSGKTVALSNIIADIAIEKKCCAYFFCQSGDRETLKPGMIIRGVAHQWVVGTFSRCYWDNLGTSQYSQSHTIEHLAQLLVTLLPKDTEYQLVVDGLEECGTDDLEDVLQHINKLRSVLTLSLCYSTRANSTGAQIIERRLTAKHKLSMNDPARDTEIHAYIQAEVQRRNSLRRQPLERDVANFIVKQLEIGSQGM